MIKRQIKTFTPNFVLHAYSKFKEKNRTQLEVKKWISEGKPSPPPHYIKQKVIQELQIQYGIDVFIESGTYKGDMLKAQIKYFKKLYSIELDEALYLQATTTFRDVNKVQIYQGDSGEVIEEILDNINERALFWLDGHYDFTPITAQGSEVCPVLRELDKISKKNLQHIILIDDYRLFKKRNGYPEFAEVENFIEDKFKNYRVLVDNDIIQLFPN